MIPHDDKSGCEVSMLTRRGLAPWHVKGLRQLDADTLCAGEKASDFTWFSTPFYEAFSPVKVGMFST